MREEDIPAAFQQPSSAGGLRVPSPLFFRSSALCARRSCSWGLPPRRRAACSCCRRHRCPPAASLCYLAGLPIPPLRKLCPLAGPTELPLRLLTGFEVVDESGVVQPLTSLTQQPGLALSGQLVPAQGSAAAAAEPGPNLTAAPLIDWVVEQSPVPGQPPAVWAVSQRAWYRLLQPSARYAPLFEAAQHAAGAQVEVRACMERRDMGPAYIGPARPGASHVGCAHPPRPSG